MIRIPSLASALEEAFRSGFASRMVPKIANVVSKRVGEDFSTNAEMPMTYENSYGRYAGYLCLGKTKAFRINFLLSDSDYVESVDFFEGTGNLLEPDQTVEFEPGDNIVNIVNSISAVLQGEPLDEEFTPRLLTPRIAERKSKGQQAVFDWIASDPEEIENDIQNRRLSRVMGDYLDWAAENNRLQVTQPTFNKAVKRYLKDKGLSNKFLKAGSKRKSQKGNLIVDPSEEEDFDEMLQMNTQDQKEAIQSYMDILDSGTYKSMIVTGRPGIGKTTIVVNYAKKQLNLPVETISGGVGSAKDLYEYLFRHRHNELLIFDDIDDVLLSKPMQRLLKPLLDMSFEKEHTVTFLDKRFVPPEDYEDMTPKQKQRNTPNRFQYTSRIVFISNSPREKFDPAVLSRSLNVDFDMSNEEVIQSIEDNIGKFLKSIDKSIKLKVLEFLRENFDIFRNLDYRHFYKAVVLANAAPDDRWKKWAFGDIASS